MKFPKKLTGTSSNSNINNLKGSSKVLSLIDHQNVKNRHTSAARNYHLTGRVGLRLRERPRSISPEASTCVLIRDANGNYEFKEDDNKAWGFLVENKAKPYLLVRHVEDRKTNESAGYSIGGDPGSAIRLAHKDVEQDHAFIYGVKSQNNKGDHKVAVYLSNRSANGIWVNLKKMQTATMELFAEDEIRFFDPEKYKDTTENPVFTFIRNPNWAAASPAGSIDQLFVIGRKVGSGAFGHVFSAQCKKTKKTVAMKVIYKNALENRPKAKESLLREIGVCLSCPVHPCIIQVNRLFDMNDKMYIIMEYGVDGDLFDNVTSANVGLREYEVKIIFDQIAHAIAFLHERGIVHRDIKLENIIMCDRKSLTAKLCDFGLSTFIRKNKLLETSCGTFMYAAPELLESHGYGREIDIWSLGVLLFTALAISTPFVQVADEGKEEDRQRLKDQIKKGDFDYSLPIWKTISNDAKSLIDNMMMVDKEKRYTIQQVLAHPWLKNIESEDALKAGLCRNQDLVKYLEKKQG